MSELFQRIRLEHDLLFILHGKTVVTDCDQFAVGDGMYQAVEVMKTAGLSVLKKHNIGFILCFPVSLNQEKIIKHIILRTLQLLIADIIGIFFPGIGNFNAQDFCNGFFIAFKTKIQEKNRVPSRKNL